MNEELQELVRVPREDMNIELKRWMDPSDKVVQAKFAKELIALRNHGGGFLVIGFLDEHPPVADPNRPTDLAAFNTDYFNGIVKRYAEPPFHCVSHVVAHPESGATFPVVHVPGGSAVPVRCKSESPDGGKSIKLDSYYIRRPGPESSTPQTGAEWDALLERCLLNRGEDLMSKMASLLGAGRASMAQGAEAAAKHPFTELREFRDSALARLEELQQALPEEDPARFKHGRYVLAARIVGEMVPMTVTEALERMRGLRQYTGWSPMYIFTKPGLEPYPVGDDLIECWLRREAPADTAHSDFWRASTNGCVVLVRGHQEDAAEVSASGGAPAPGGGIELTLPVWRTAEFLLRVRELGERWANGPFRIQLIAQWDGLAGRRLFSHGGRRHLSNDYVAHSASWSGEAEFEPGEVDAALPTVVSKLLGPLYRRFSFFDAPAQLYDDEVRKLVRRELA